MAGPHKASWCLWSFEGEYPSQSDRKWWLHYNTSLCSVTGIWRTLKGQSVLLWTGSASRDILDKISTSKYQFTFMLYFKYQALLCCQTTVNLWKYTNYSVHTDFFWLTLFKGLTCYVTDPVHNTKLLSIYVGTPLCFSKLGACRSASTAAITLPIDKYLTQPLII